MEGCGGSGEGEAAEAPDLVGEKVRSFQVMSMEARGSELPLTVLQYRFSCI